MNEDWKKKYYFDEKTRVFESPVPSQTPNNVSPFVKKDEDKKLTKEIKNEKAGKKKENCSIA